MRYRILVYILAIYLPFYMPLRILYPGLIVYLHDFIVGLFLIIFIYKKTSEQNRIDVLMVGFLMYSLMMVFFLSAIKGGPPLIIKHIHTFISGIFMYFVARNILNKQIFNVLLNFYIYVAIIISILFCYEWINVNIFGNAMFSWVYDYYNEFGVGEQFLKKGHLGFYRPMGVIGYSHATGIFLSGCLGIVYSKHQQNLNIKNLPVILLLIVSIILTASRIAIASTIIIFLTNWSIKLTKNNLKGVFYIFVVIIVLIFTFRSLGKNDEIVFFTKMLSGSFGGAIGEGSIIDSFVGVFNRDIQQVKLIYSNYPIALFTGAGFPFYGQGKILNPVLTNDTYFLMWITQYGLFGSLLMLFCLINVFVRIKRILKLKILSGDDKIIMLSAYRVLLIYLFSTIHSSSIQMYPIYFGFFTFLGISNYMTSPSFFKKEIYHTY